MKKNSFLEGAAISVFGIVLCKVLGLLYVIPFYALISDQARNLYAYAYSVYGVFLDLSVCGIPIAMSKIVSEYNALGYYETRERAFHIGRKLILAVGILTFVVLFVFAPQISYLIIGDVSGGNTIEDISFVIRIVATAILVVPSLSVSRGYLQGLKILSVPTASDVIEQLVRVGVLIAGSFVVIRIFHLSDNIAVAVSVFAATLGALAALLFIYRKIRANRDSLGRDAAATEVELGISNHDILRKIIMYALPFVIINIIQSAYSTINMVTVVTTLNDIGYSAVEAENTLSVITTWGPKLNTIITSIAMGITASLVPNISGAYVRGDMRDVSAKINQTLQILLFLTLPMTFGLWFLSGDAWTIFYGYDAFKISIFEVSVLTSITTSFYSILLDTTQVMNNTRITLGTLLTSFVLKAVLNVPMMHLFALLGLPANQAPTFTTLLIQAGVIFFLTYQLRRHFGVTYGRTLRVFVKVSLSVALMLIALSIFWLVIPIHPTSRTGAIIEAAVYALAGGGVYLLCAFKFKLITDIFDQELLDKVKNRLKLSRFTGGKKKRRHKRRKRAAARRNRD